MGATEARIGKWAGNNNAKGVTAAAVVGGTASALGGGKFANGAVSGAFSYLFNWASRQDWPVHQTANQRALGGKLTAAQIAILDRATVLLDADQSVEDEYMHAMRDLDHNQTVDQARALADGYVRAQYKMAWDFLKAGKESLALFHFGLALHTLQDATSPSHWGFQGWTQKETDEGGSNIDVLKHVIPERNYPGDKSALYNVTQQAYGWYKQGSLPQQNVFVGLPHD